MIFWTDNSNTIVNKLLNLTFSKLMLRREDNRTGFIGRSAFALTKSGAFQEIINCWCCPARSKDIALPKSRFVWRSHPYGGKDEVPRVN